MARSIFLPLLILLSMSGCSYADSHIEGKWRYAGVVGKSLSLECPDVLVLEANSSYYVLNDCYGLNISKPITEVGVWKLNENSGELVLSQRSFKGNYHLINAGSVLEVKVLKLTDKELVISTGSGSKFDEIYERLSN